MPRKIGSKDKQKRKRRLLTLAVPLGFLGGLGGIAYGLNKMNENRVKDIYKRELDLLEKTKKAAREASDYDVQTKKNLYQSLYDEAKGNTNKVMSLEDKLVKDRVTPSSAKVGLILDDINLDKKLAGRTSKGANRLRNLSKIMRGSVNDKFSGLAANLYVLQNYKKYNLDKVVRKNLIKQVSGKLKYLKAAGRFNSRGNLITFGRNIGS